MTRMKMLTSFVLPETSSGDNLLTSEEKEKPESVNSGFNGSSGTVQEPDRTEKTALPILSDVPNLYNSNGTSMENLGYFIFPRSVANDPRYQSARLKYRHVLFIILKNAAFSPTTHAICTEIIPIQIGQLCVSERRLVDLCNEGAKFKEDFVDKNIVRRAVHFWATCQYLNHEVIHDKTLLTITLPEFYERNKNVSEPASEPKVNQNRTTKEEHKEHKELKKNTKLARTTSSPHLNSDIFFCFDSRIFQNITDQDLTSWKELYPAVNVPLEIKRMEEWCLSNKQKSQSKKRWRSFITIWLQKNNEQAINKEAFKKQYQPNSLDRITKDIHGNPVKSPHEGRF